MKNNVKYYQVAGITVQVNSDFPISENTFHPKFRLFEVDGPSEDNIIIHHHFHLPVEKKTFDHSHKVFKDNQWEIFKTENTWIYKYNPIFENTGFPSIGFFNKDHTSNHIYTDKISKEIYQNYSFPSLTLFNNDQILFAKLLSDRNGIIIHSNGFNIGGKGVLLTGNSGVGKSTLSKMLKNCGHNILCDDRMFTIKKKDGFWIYGSWCHGTVPDSSSMAVPLKAIFFLEQSKENTISLIENKKVIVAKLIKSLVRPLMTHDGWENTFEILSHLPKDVLCYKLKFDLSGKICKQMEDLIEESK